jgi:hypothetical protein
MKFRKKPVVVEAWQWLPFSDTAEAKNIPHWLVMSNYDLGPNDTLEISTLEGVMVANPSDWIIQGVKGEVYPCKPDIFEATYDPA